MASQIKLRRGTKQQWISAAPIYLAIGEPGLEIDTHKVKYGDGSTEWQALPYASEPIPSQTGNAGKFLTTDGNGNLSWAAQASDNDSMYVTNSSLTTTLSSYATTASLSSYATTASLSSYATTTALSNLIPTQTGNNGKVLTTNGSSLSWTTISQEVGLGNFTFTDSVMHIPVIGGGSESYLNAGGIGVHNSVQLRTAISYVDTDINTSEIALEAGNGGFSAQVYGHYTGGANGSGGPTLVYAGVENVSGANGPGFAGFVAIDPTVSSQYAIALDGSNNINLGQTTTQYTAGIGALNKTTGSITGLLATPNKLVLNNSNNAWVFGTDGSLTLPYGQLDYNEPYSRFKDANNTGVQLGSPDDQNYVNVDNTAVTIQVNSDGVSGPHTLPVHNWVFDTAGALTLPQNAIISDTGNSVVISPNHLASDFQLEIKAYNDIVTPDDIHIRANNTNYGLVIGDSNGGSFVNVNGDTNHNTVVISTINKNDEERKDFTFDVLGNLNVPGDVRVSAVGAFKNSAGIRAAYINEIPMDVSDLTDNMSLLPKDISPVEIDIDGGHALAFFAIPTNADGGGSAGRFGPNSIVFDGGGASGTYTNTLNGGGA